MRDYRPDELIPGTVYRVVRPIGAGGMGTVYEVEDTTIGKPYVLKTLHPQLGSRGDLARRMQNEARTLARLAHPHIVEVITAGVTGDELRLPFFVMERLTGQSLRSIIQRRGRLELPHAWNIALELLEALDYAHENGVIHRDVKPDNIFLHRGASGVTTTKLLDFGIMSLLDQVSRETGGRFLGTLRYAAPEQLRGDRATPKVDIYAAGLVIYEMIVGQGPFDDVKDTRQLAAAHMNTPAPLLSRYVPVPPELDALVASALAKAPDDRPRDAYSFGAALRNIRRHFGSLPEVDAAAESQTASAVMQSTAPEAPYVKVQQGGPGGPIVIAPGLSASAPRLPAPASASPPPPPTIPEPRAARAQMVETTQLGMSPPTDAGGPSATTTATTPESVDRTATTHTLQPETPRAPEHGTEPFPASDTTTAPFAVASRPGEVEEEGDGTGATETDDEVAAAAKASRTEIPRRALRSKGGLALLGTGLALVAVILLVSVVSVVRSSHGEPAPARSGAPVSPSAAVAVQAPVPAASPAIAVPAAPETAPFASAGVEAEPAAESPGASAEPARTAAPQKVTRAPAPSGRAVERPGPGF